ncbi:g6171 [Coccomyxa elongata]
MSGSSWPAVASSSKLKEKMKSSKILCVGAGGIGCELLKTLVLTGFEDIELIDLDTIETSNLNRQFLFRRRHVGESKAKVAAEAVRAFRPNAKITAHQGNVKDSKFDKEFFKRFALVLNGLDNVEARRHVNRLCLSAGVPLIESGTEGYLGQVTVHYRLKNAAGEATHVTECFECAPKQSRNKTYPVCTIRNTPDKPIHCIVWAKELLFARLFGRPDQVTDLDEGENKEEGEEAREEGPSAFLRQDGESVEAYAARIFKRVFTDDIENVLTMEDLWENRDPPSPLKLDEILAPSATGVGDSAASNGNAATIARSNGSAHAAGDSACKALGLTDAHRVWNLRENAQVFLESIRQFLEGRPGEVGEAVFDKEDDLAVEFVTAASNLRAAAYGIPQQSQFDAKGMAGNIIHAIATTNAIVGGLIVIEAMKLLAGVPEHSKATFIAKHVTNPKMKRLLNAVSPGEPSPKCAACGTARLELIIDTNKTTLSQLIDKVLRKKLSLVEPTVRTDAGFEYEEGEGLDEDEVAANAAKLPIALAALPGGGLGQGVIAHVEDQVQDFKVAIEITHQDDWDEEVHPEGFILGGSMPQPVSVANGDQSEAGPSAPDGSAAAEEDDDDLIIMEEPDLAQQQRDAKGKQKRSAEESEAPRKRQRVMGRSDDIIMLD